MQILILKTNIRNHRDRLRLQPVLDVHPSIIQWSVDLDDVDRVLRLEVADGITYQDIIGLVSYAQFNSEELQS